MGLISSTSTAAPPATSIALTLNCPGRFGPTGDNHIGGKANKFGRVSADSGLIVGAEAKIEPQVPTLGPTELC